MALITKTVVLQTGYFWNVVAIWDKIGTQRKSQSPIGGFIKRNTLYNDVERYEEIFCKL